MYCNSIVIKKKFYYLLIYYIIDIMKYMFYFFFVFNLINKFFYIIICNVKMGLFKFSINIFIYEYIVNVGNVSFYDLFFRYVGLDILEYWLEMLCL